ncbi:MAG TPA: metallophosphoesterase [Flavisolibacter sp.]|nr:metallophosphoesterase [Flavisolibacter sp.]
MAQWLRKALFKPVLWASEKFASRPERQRVFDGLTELLQSIKEGKKSKGPVVTFGPQDRFIIFSDQHKGAKNGADDFMLCEPNYLAALDYYLQEDFHLVTLGDSEELWENLLPAVLKHQQPSFDRYKQFIAKNKFFKTIGNHDLDWKNDPITILQIKSIFDADISIYDGIVLQTTIGEQTLCIFCTHGHQGDKASDGNWFSKFFVSRIWAPLQAFTRINPNTPAYDASLKTLHNKLMYEWSSAQKNLLLITGHTHQPVFESLTHIERLYRQAQIAEHSNDSAALGSLQQEIQKRKFEYDHVTDDFRQMKPTYYNAGCCCFNDGDITGIEIAEGCLRLIKWAVKEGKPQRLVLEEETLEVLLAAVA